MKKSLVFGLGLLVFLGGVGLGAKVLDKERDGDDLVPTPTVSQVLVATDPSFPQLVGKYFKEIPKLPVYSDAVLVGSAKTNPENVKDTGYRILWKSKTGVPVIMKWASQEFKKWGWKVDELGDPDNEGEQVMQIDNDQFIGTFSAEHGGEDEINIIVQILYK